MYLDDHRAGSEAGSRLAALLTAHDPTAHHILRGLDVEIERDREQLQLLMDTLGIKPSRFKRMSAAAAELASRVKLRLINADEPSAGWLLALEALSAGVEAKQRLWLNLQSVVDVEPRLTVVNLGGLHERAARQLQLLDQCRAEVARAALTH